jgi:hypothetical protein
MSWTPTSNETHMRHKLFALCALAALIVACNLANPVLPTATTAPSVVVPTNTADTRGVVTLNNVSFTLPIGVANDALSEMVSAVTDVNAAPSWELAPAHIQFKLTGYQLQGKFHEPHILVYPVNEYSQLNPAAAEQIQRLKTLLAGATPTRDAMPIVPAFNAGPIFAAHMQLLDFQSGRGVRMVTQYAQYLATVNNHELFYHFQGLTNDGKYYIIAVLPVSSSILAEDDKLDSSVPPGGVPAPATGPDAAYYEAVTTALNAMYPDSFNPSLFQLDTLIKSITVTP